jgi:PAS domain S-box-containing protein
MASEDRKKKSAKENTDAPRPGQGPEICEYSDQDWENIFNSITDMVTIHDKDFNIICANRAAKKLLSLPILNVKRAKCFEYYHGTETPPEGCPSCRCLVTGEASTTELFEPHLKMHPEIRALPRFDENNQLIGLIHIVRNITKRKKAEDELEKHRHHLEELVEERTLEMEKERNRAQNYLDVANAMLLVIGADHKIRLINKKGCEILACDEKEITGRNWFDTFLPENDRDKGRSTFDKLMEGEIEPAEYTENPVVTMNGEERIIAWHNTVLEDDSGTIIGTLSSGQDVTERRMIAAEKEKLIAELQRALSEIKTLSGLIPICAWCKKIRDDKGYWKQVEEYIKEHSGAEFTHSICKDCLKKFEEEAGRET